MQHCCGEEGIADWEGLPVSPGGSRNLRLPGNEPPGDFLHDGPGVFFGHKKNGACSEAERRVNQREGEGSGNPAPGYWLMADNFAVAPAMTEKFQTSCFFPADFISCSRNGP